MSFPYEYEADDKNNLSPGGHEELKAAQILGLREDDSIEEDCDAEDFDQQDDEKDDQQLQEEDTVSSLEQRLHELDEEADTLAELEESTTTFNKEGQAPGSDEDVDNRSIYVGNVDYGATPQELQELFKTCGTIYRVTILLDKYTQHPRGYAYVEFTEPGSVEHAMLLSDSVFRGRQIKVMPKRKNIPAFHLRGRAGFRGRGRVRRRPGMRGGAPPYRGRGMSAAPTGYGAFYRGRARGGFGAPRAAPY